MMQRRLLALCLWWIVILVGCQPQPEFPPTPTKTPAAVAIKPTIAPTLAIATTAPIILLVFDDMSDPEA